MTPTTHDPELARRYEEAEQEYLRSLPPEHFMEATDHARQREITVESFAVVRTARPDIQCFNELLVQYPRAGETKYGQVVPDNFVVVHPDPIQARGSFNLPLQPVGPFLMLEYVSKYSKRKDYEENYDRYERELAVPYYFLFYPDSRDLSVFHLADGKYVSVKPDESGRLAIPELELHVALVGDWARFWFRGELVPLPEELVHQRDAARKQHAAARKQRDAAQKQRDRERVARLAAEQRATVADAEIARLMAELARAKGG